MRRRGRSCRPARNPSERGVEAVVILDGKVNHAVLLELFTDYGAGTLIRRG
jgi:acetylglutamate kinase